MLSKNVKYEGGSIAIFRRKPKNLKKLGLISGASEK
jgi:hypothetical protein